MAEDRALNAGPWPAPGAGSLSRRGSLSYWLPLAVVLVAFLLRTVQIQSAPPGVTHDEAAHVQDAERIWQGLRPIYLTTAYGREPLYDYVAAPLVHLLDVRVLPGRLVSAFWGTLTVALVYAWARRALDQQTALLAALLIAASFWPVGTSRQILRSAALPAIILAGYACYWQAVYRATERRSPAFFAMAGLLQGLAAWTYMPARITWLVPALFHLSLAFADRRRWRSCRAGFVVMLVVLALVAAPLAAFLLQHPEVEVRVDELAAPLRALAAGDAGPLAHRLKQSIGLLTHRGDTQWLYNISGRPLLPPLVACLFLGGLVLAIVGSLRATRPGLRFLLLWLPIGLFPALVTGLESSSLRAIAAQPSVYILAAVPVAIALRWSSRRWPARGLILGTILMLASLAGLASLTAGDYLVRWAENPNTRVAYHAHLKQIAAYLDGQPDQSTVTVSTLYPGPLHDPYAASTLLRRLDLSILWHNGAGVVVFPRVSTARALVPAGAPLSPSLAALMGPSAQLVDRVMLRSDDLSPWIDVYRWSPVDAIAALPLDDRSDMGHVLAFAGYKASPDEVQPGGWIELITFWEILETLPAEPELVLFSHLLADGQVTAQDDRLDLPSSSWRPGDLFAQLHRLNVPSDLPAGDYPLEIGGYLRTEGYPRLPIYQDNQPVGDRLVLAPVRITTPP
jgi:4-amino-4-deoxy-L-arabinose transferase-like glycosyltransferase